MSQFYILNSDNLLKTSQLSSEPVIETELIHKDLTELTFTAGIAHELFTELTCTGGVADKKSGKNQHAQEEELISRPDKNNIYVGHEVLRITMINPTDLTFMY